jgi:penicillin-binding protein 1A
MERWRLPTRWQSPSSWRLPEDWRLPERLRAALQHRRVRLALAVTLSVAFAAAALGGVAWQTCGFSHCPQVERLTAYRPGGASLLLDRNGRVIGDLAPEDRPVVQLAALPWYVPAAFVAIEDRRFFAHGAIDWRRAFGALAANLRARAFEQGFSTITMQLARNVYPEEIPGQERTTGRKLLEIRVAQAIEARFSKPEILELYLNHIYFGNGAHGIDAAAEQYFGRPAAKLTPAQAALLAALPKAPSRYDPRRHPARALARRNLVLERMARQGQLAPEAARRMRQEPLGVIAAPEQAQSELRPARYFAEEVRHELEERFGDSLYTHPLRVWTTLDLDIQRAAEDELGHQLRAIEAGKLGRFSRPALPAARSAASAGDAAEAGGDKLEGAVVMLATGSGDVLAWVGGRDYNASRFDRVTRARRQAGSAWKPFVYAAALTRGYALSQPLDDTPLTITLSGGERWEPRNFDGRFDGQVSLREALVRSKNVPTVRLGQEVGYEAIADLARRAGISGEVPLLPSMPLGTVSVSPLELTTAYTAFSGLGQKVEPRLVLRVERPDGTVLWQQPPPRREEVLEPAVAYLVDDVLRDALRRGTGAPGLPVGVAGQAAGKTGTSTGGDDVWFVGFTPDVVAGVWIGFDQPRPIADQATGGRLAAPVWGRMMSRAYAGRPAPRPWPVPPAVVALRVDRATGLPVPPGCEAAAGAAPAALTHDAASAGPGSGVEGDGSAGAGRPSADGGASRPSSDGGDDRALGPGAAGADDEAPTSEAPVAEASRPVAVTTYRELFIAGREPAAFCPGQGAPPQTAFFTSRLEGSAAAPPPPPAANPEPRAAVEDEPRLPDAAGNAADQDASQRLARLEREEREKERIAAEERRFADRERRRLGREEEARQNRQPAAGEPAEPGSAGGGRQQKADPLAPPREAEAEPAPPAPAAAAPGRAAPPDRVASPTSAEPAGGGGAPGGSEAGGAARSAPPGGDAQEESSKTAAGSIEAGAAPRAGALAFPDRGRQPAAPAGDLNGWWQITNTIDTSRHPEFRGLRLTYRIALHQEGTRVTGEGEKWEENGHSLPAGARTTIRLTGTVSGREIRLRFLEQGTVRSSGGSFRWRLASGGSRLDGTFESNVAASRGGSTAVRLR